MMVLRYNKWKNFHKVIKSAMLSCKNSGCIVCEHFPEVRKTIVMPKGGIKKIINYHLFRYACYLIAQNGDSRKKTIALAQTYFAIQTRKMEMMEKEYSRLTEDEKRLYQRNLTKKGNYLLNQIAKKSGVKNFDKFHNYGYKGLYNEITADDIEKRHELYFIHHYNSVDNVMKSIRKYIKEINNMKIIDCSNSEVIVYTNKENIDILMKNYNNYFINEYYY